jgi:hypothetical protein
MCGLDAVVPWTSVLYSLFFSPCPLSKGASTESLLKMSEMERTLQIIYSIHIPIVRPREERGFVHDHSAHK